MALHDEILRDIRAGRVPFRFKTSDLKKTMGASPGRYKVGSNEYAENSITTIPRNHSICPDGTNPGDYVRKGRKPAFYWYGEGTFELILNREHYLREIVPGDESFDAVEGDDETLMRVDGSGVIRCHLTMEVDSDTVRRIAEREPDPVAIIVAYIANQPFQAYFRGKPVGSPSRGWGARLDSYFWPSRTQNWAITRAHVNGLASQIQHAIERLKQDPDDVAAAHQLLDSFKATCV